MKSEGAFVDYYAVLGVNPSCGDRTLEAAYHSLAKRHHPDHALEPDIAKFTEVVEAYKLLRDPILRAEFDNSYAKATGHDFTLLRQGLAEEHSAISDSEMHGKILLALYKQRREHADDAGMGRYQVQELLCCSDQLFDFHIWYLKEKRLLAITEQGMLAITIEGVDHVISMSQSSLKEKLLLEQSHGEDDQRFRGPAYYEGGTQSGERMPDAEER